MEGPNKNSGASGVEGAATRKVDMGYTSSTLEVSDAQKASYEADKNREYKPEAIAGGIYDLLTERMDIDSALAMGSPNDPVEIEVKFTLNTNPRTAMTVVLECSKDAFFDKLKETLTAQIAEKNITRPASIVDLTGDLHIIKAEEAENADRKSRKFSYFRYKQIID